MTTPNNRMRPEDVARALARLFSELPDTDDPRALGEELATHGVDPQRLAARLQEIVRKSEAAEKLAWLEAYRERQTAHAVQSSPPSDRRALTREEKVRRIEELASAVGFRKLTTELTDADLDHILAEIETPGSDLDDSRG
jgi:hypothetical protein